MRPYIDLDKIEETDYYQSTQDSAYEFYRTCAETIEIYYRGNKIGTLKANIEHPLKKQGDEYLKLCGIVDLFFNNYMEGQI
jgi:hypothetical protein